MRYNKRPFTAAVSRARENGATYEDLATRSGRARSQKWFWDLLNNDDPWVVLPPGRDQFDGMCALLAVSRATLETWIAAEWYSIKDVVYSPDTIGMAAMISSLNEENADILKALVKSMWSTQMREKLCDIEVELRLIAHELKAA